MKAKPLPPKHHFFIATPNRLNVHSREIINKNDILQHGLIKLLITDVLAIDQSSYFTFPKHRFYQLNYKVLPNENTARKG